MADFRTDPKLLTPLVASASFPVSLAGVTYAADDYVIFGLVCSTSSGTVSETSGLGTTWTLQTLYVASGCRMVIGYAKVAAGPTISAPTITISAGTPNWQGWVGSLFDVDPSTFLAGTVATVDPAAAASSATTGMMTPTSDDAFVLYFTSSKNTSQGTYTRFLSGDVVGRVLQAFDDGVTFMSMALGTVQQGAAAATAKTFYSNALTNNRIGGMVIPIKNKASGVKARHGVGGITKVAWLGDFGVIHDTNITWSGPDNGGTTWDGSGNINGIPVDSAFDVDPTTPLPAAPTVQWGVMTNICNNVSTTGKWGGRKAAFSSAVDMSGKLFSTEWVLPLLGIQVGAEGILLVFKDSSDYWKAFQLSAKLDVKVNTLNTSIIDLTNATPYASGGGGTLVLSDVRSIHGLLHRTGSSTTRRGAWFRNWNLLSATVVKGGSSTSKLTPEFLDKVMNGWGYAGLCSVQGNAVMVKSDVQIGDGSTATYYDATATLINFPAAYNALTQREVQVGANGLEIRVLASASDTINDIASATAGAQEQDWIIDPSSSTSAVYSLAGKSLVNMRVSLQPGIDYAGVTIKGTTINLAAAGTYEFIVAQDTTINFTPTGASTYVMGDCSITGTLDLRNTTAHAITVELPTGTATTTANNTGGTITVSTPTITAGISITGMSNTVGANNRLQIINSTAAAAASRANSTAYSVGDVRLRQTGVGSENTAGLYLRCTTAGTSAGTPPTWNTTVGGTTTDGTAVWTTYAVLYYDADPAATSLTDTYIDGQEFLAGETVKIRFAEEDPAVSFKSYSTSVIVATTGFSALANSTADSVYATYALSGAAYDTTYSPNYVASYLVLDTNTNFTGASSFAYYCYLLTTSEGMYRFWGGLTALDAGNVRNNVDVLDLFFDETAGFVRQTDDVRIFKSDGTRPALDPTTGGAGIEINWKVPVNVVTTGGSALTPTESAQLMALPSATTTANACGTRAVDGTKTQDEILRLLAAVGGGKVSGAGTGTETFRGVNDDKDRIVADVDSSGNRTSITLDLT